jgi:hypothetical protein
VVFHEQRGDDHDVRLTDVFAALLKAVGLLRQSLAACILNRKLQPSSAFVELAQTHRTNGCPW